MKLYPIYYCFFFLLFFNNCQKEALPDLDFLIFGQYCNYCVTECVKIYKIEDGQLFKEQELQHFFEPNTLQFNSPALPESKFLISQQLIQEFPMQLLDAEEEVFGLPDAHDQCGLFVHYKRGDTDQYWYIDTVEERLPKYLQPYAEQIKKTVQNLEE